MGADDEIDSTRAEIAAAAELIARLRRDRENKAGAFDIPDEPEDGGRKSTVRQKATRTVGRHQPSARRSGVSGRGIG